jgi:hypothetical protein
MPPRDLHVSPGTFSKGKKKTGEAVKRDKLGRAGAGDDDEAASVGRWWDLAPLDGHQPATCRSWTLTVPPRPMHADADAVVPLGSARLVVVSSNFSSSSTTLVVYR